MTYDPEKHHRKSIRLKGHDYSWPGAYFVTICANKHKCVFGRIVKREMRLNKTGRIVKESWENIPRHFTNIVLDEYVVMPNHIHGILIITQNVVGARHASPLQDDEETMPRGPTRHSMGAVVGSFKSAAARRINEARDAPGAPVWQKNYYEHVIRDHDDLTRIRRYICDNSACWEEDEENPANYAR